MRDNKNDWIDSIAGDDLRSRLAKASIPARDAPAVTKKPKKLKFRRPLIKKLSNPVDVDKAKAKGSKVEVSVNLTLPKPKLHVKKLAKKYRSSTYAKVMSVIAVVIVLNIVAVSVVKKHNNSAIKGASTGANGKSSSPDYKPVLPSGSAANTISGKLSYDSEKKVTSYTDKIGDNQITISEQPLPPDFKDNPDGRVEIFAKNANFNDLIQYNGGRAHIGTSIKGPQSVVFHKDGLLIFLKSDKKILNADWVKYINSLQSAKE